MSNPTESVRPSILSGGERIPYVAMAAAMTAADAVRPDENVLLFVAYRRALLTDLQPVGREELDLVERMAASQWRLKRLWRRESGQEAPGPAERACREREGRAGPSAAEVDRSEAKLSREYLRCSRRLQELQDLRRKGLRPGAARVTRVLVEAQRTQDPAAVQGTGAGAAAVAVLPSPGPQLGLGEGPGLRPREARGGRTNTSHSDFVTALSVSPAESAPWHAGASHLRPVGARCCAPARATATGAKVSSWPVVPRPAPRPSTAWSHGESGKIAMPLVGPVRPGPAPRTTRGSARPERDQRIPHGGHTACAGARLAVRGRHGVGKIRDGTRGVGGARASPH